MIVPPCLSLLSQQFSRKDLFLVVYCLVDSWMKQRFNSSNMPRPHRGPMPWEFADSEVLTVLLVQEICHCPREKAWLRQVRGSYLDLFPALPEDSRFNRRAQMVQDLLREFRAQILYWADADLERVRIVDSFPSPLCACYRIRQSTIPITSWFGYNASKKQYYFGLHPLLVVTESGFIQDILLAPGNWPDTGLLAAYLEQCRSEGKDLSFQHWILDKGFFDQDLIDRAHRLLGIHLHVRKPKYRGPRRKAKQTEGQPQAQEQEEQPPSFSQQLLDRLRKPIEGVVSALSECFGIERLLARTDRGVYRRVEAKATAFSLARYFNLVFHPEQPWAVARFAV